jgi:hypothetical protein
MTGLEAAAAAARTVAKRAGREWLAARAAATDRDKDLTELIRVSFPDRFARRKLERQLADIADSVERRLTPLIEQDVRRARRQRPCGGAVGGRARAGAGRPVR